MTTKNTLSSKKNFLTAIGAVASVAILLFLFSPSSGGGPQVGSHAPSFSLTDLGGRTANLSDYRGKVVLLDFWATWCVTCEQELPELKSLHSEFKDNGFSLLAIACDDGGPEIVANFAAKNQLPYLVLFADDETKNDYRIFGLPTKFLLDADGKIFRKYLANTSRDEIAADIKTLLKGKAS